MLSHTPALEHCLQDIKCRVHITNPWLQCVLLQHYGHSLMDSAHALVGRRCEDGAPLFPTDVIPLARKV